MNGFYIYIYKEERGKNIKNNKTKKSKQKHKKFNSAL